MNLSLLVSGVAANVQALICRSAIDTVVQIRSNELGREQA
jgi:hypothetical protein